MKTHISLFIFFLLFIAYINPAFSQTQPIDSKIDKVTVFLSGAQVNRTSTVKIPAGRTELIFKGISPKLDQQSIQVKGDGAFTILSVNHQLNFLEEQQKRKEIEVLEQEKYRLVEQKKQQAALISVLKQEQEILSKNQSVGGTNTGVVAEELIQAVNFQRERLTDISQQRLEIEKTLFAIDSTVAKIDKQLIALNREKETATSEIIVTVSAKTTVTGKFDISYYVLDAAWFATYDLRVKDVSNPIDLSFKANVFQQSGEDWKDVKLTLSSGNPTESGFAQMLYPWYLRYGRKARRNYAQSKVGQGRGGINNVSGVVTDENGEPLIGATILVKGTAIGTVTDIDGSYSLNVPSDPSNLVISYTGFTTHEVPVNSNEQNVTLNASTQMLSEVAVIAYGMNRVVPKLNFSKLKGSRTDRTIAQENIESYQATTVSFEIEEKYTIPSDGKTRMVDVKTETVPANYQYFAAPKLDENAYLTALVTDWQDLNLLDGEVNLFFEGAFLGKSLLDTRNAEDTMEVSLGIDKGIVVKRTKLKDFTLKRFLGSNKIETRAFEILVRNNKPQPIHISIEDQFPISTNKNIVVHDLEYNGAERDKETEILTWKFELPARKERKLNLKYSVKFPKNKYLEME